MDNLQKLMEDSRSEQLAQQVSVNQAIDALLSKAGCQLRMKAWKRRRANEEEGMFMNGPDQVYIVSDAAIFKLYKALVQKHMIDAPRLRERVASGNVMYSLNKPKDY